MKLFGGQTSKRFFSQKELVLNYLGYYYGTYFDSQGQKQHFFEMDTLRKIRNQFDLFRLPEDSEGYSDALSDADLDLRYMKLLSYSYNPFARENLADYEERALLTKWLRMDIGRRSRDIVDYIHSRRRKLDSHDRAYLSPTYTRGYSYGELIQDLYWASRTEYEDKKAMLSKEMIHCILASYSVVLPKLMYSAQKCDNQKYKRWIPKKRKSLEEEQEFSSLQNCKEDYESLKRVIGTSIAGLWSNKILYTDFWAYRENDDTALRIRRGGKIGSVSMRSFDNVSFSEVAFSYKDIVDIKQLFKEFVQCAELIGMFFTNVREYGGEEQKQNRQTSYRFSVSKVDEISDRYFLYPQTKYACFNILNFVVNSFCWDEYFEALHEDMANALTVYIKENSLFYILQELEEATTTERQIKKGIEAVSLKDEFKKWSQGGGKGVLHRFALPIHHFDMAYNIIKHQHNGGEQELPLFAGPEKFISCCTTVYQNFQSSLRSQDEFYQLCEPALEQCFAENPFIKHFYNINEGKEQTSESFKAVVDNLVTMLVNDLNMPTAARRLIDDALPIFTPVDDENDDWQ